MATSQAKKDKKQSDETSPEQCFVIMPISSQQNYEEGHFSLVYEDIIKPAIESSGLISVRADETKNTNLIQLDILRNVIESPMAVCDMSSKNPNVFYELGMRQAFDLPTVLIKDEITEAPFDINGLRYVTYKKDMKHRDVKLAVQELTETIKDTYSKREDKAEINSLIRLMDLADPAKINQVELTEEARYEKLNELHLKEITNSIDVLRSTQIAMLNRLEDKFGFMSEPRHNSFTTGESSLYRRDLTPSKSLTNPIEQLREQALSVKDLEG